MLPSILPTTVIARKMLIIGIIIFENILMTAEQKNVIIEEYTADELI